MFIKIVQVVERGNGEGGRAEPLMIPNVVNTDTIKRICPRPTDPEKQSDFLFSDATTISVIGDVNAWAERLKAE